MNQKIQADYDELADMAARFADEGEAVERLTRAIDRLVNDLCSGGWIGRGADRFYSEVFELVLPALRRLGAALYDTSDATSQISRIMQEAEEHAAGLFNVSRGDPGAIQPTSQVHDEQQAVLNNLKD